jgi:hypothetical protein
VDERGSPARLDRLADRSLIHSQARYGENAGVRFATLMRLLCERNGGAFVALNSLTP